MVVDPGCMKCMDCISVCPNDALYFGFGKPTIAVPKSNAIKKNYSLTWPEEIVGAFVFLASFLAVWDVYQLVPMLMALGCATITTFLTLKTWRLLRAKELSFYRFNLKSAGKIRKAGWVFLSFARCLDWLECAQRLGALSRIRRRSRISENPNSRRAGAGADQPRSLAQSDRSREHRRRERIIFKPLRVSGCLRTASALPKLAWFVYLSGDAEQSVQLLGQAAAHQQGQAKALSLYYRGTILNRLGRYDQARTSLDEALAERPDLILAREEKGESLWQLGRKEEAISVWSDAVATKCGTCSGQQSTRRRAGVAGQSRRSNRS